MPLQRQPRIVHATAPIRVCDNGGWTDTWFARHGAVCNIAVTPRVEVEVRISDGGADGGVTINEGDSPLVRAAVEEVGIPAGTRADIAVRSEVPPGASTGTSAAVAVALVGALDALVPGRRRTPHEVAVTAHRVETDRLQLQSGIQDQLCSAHGGVNFIEMHDYPHATVSPVPLPDDLWPELERRLVLVFLGRGHVSSGVHERVIAELASEGSGSPRLDALRRCAHDARDALAAGDLAAFGAALRANTDAQQALHPDLVGKDAARVIEVAQAHGAWGWKVNGAGGEGGSVTLLTSPSATAGQELLHALPDADPRYRVIPISLSRGGLRVWEADTR